MSDILATANVFGLVWDPGQDPKVDKPVDVIPGSNLVVDCGIGIPRASNCGSSYRALAMGLSG